MGQNTPPVYKQAVIDTKNVNFAKSVLITLLFPSVFDIIIISFSREVTFRYAV